VKLKARPATLKDQAQVFVWANDKEIRKQSFITKKITKEEHDKWFSNILSDYNNQQLFILENHETRPCGQVRFSRSDRDDWEIHFSVDSHYRGQKLGVRLINVGLEGFLRKEPKSRITAKVKNDNVASLRVLAKVGFQIEKQSVPNDSETRLIYIPK